ncbi:MAG: hypothetical protein WCH93_03390 [Actinomycetota bacterium]
MSTNRTSNPGSLTLSGHRPWSGLWFGVAAMGAASGVVMVTGGAWAGWFLVIVFLPSAIVLGMSLRPQANELLLDALGYTVRSTFRSSTVAWDDVERIGTIEGVRERRVAIRMAPLIVAADPDAAAIAQAMDGYHRTLPMSYAIDAEELAALMRSYAGLDGTQTSSTTSE